MRKITEYSTIKIPEEKIKTLRIALEKTGIDTRSNAEAINVLINNFILKTNLKTKD